MTPRGCPSCRRNGFCLVPGSVVSNTVLGDELETRIQTRDAEDPENVERRLVAFEQDARDASIVALQLSLPRGESPLENETAGGLRDPQDSSGSATVT